jgi:hypothetical protein
MEMELYLLDPTVPPEDGDKTQYPKSRGLSKRRDNVGWIMSRSVKVMWTLISFNF